MGTGLSHHQFCACPPQSSSFQYSAGSPPFLAQISQIQWCDLGLSVFLCFPYFDEFELVICLLVPLPSDFPPIRFACIGSLRISISARSQLSTSSSCQSHPITLKVLPEEIFSLRRWRFDFLLSLIVSGGGRWRPLMPAIRSFGPDYAVLICQCHFIVQFAIDFATCSRRTSG